MSDDDSERQTFGMAIAEGDASDGGEDTPSERDAAEATVEFL